MQDYPKYDLCAEGRVFLSDRGLSIHQAYLMGIRSHNGEIMFPYAVNGKIIRIKYRNMTDKKKMRFSAIPESEKEKFKTPFWNQQIWPVSDYLIVTEGELDAVAIAQLGLKQVVSLPNGAGSVQTTFRNHYDYLQRFDEIYLAFDMDEAGEKAVAEAKKLIPPQKFRRIVFPAPSKDANDWVRDDPGVDKEDLEHLMRNAERISVDEIVHLKDLPECFFDAIDPGASTGWTELDNILGGIRPKEVTVISAETGAGKTTFCVNLICNVLKSQSGGFWINSWEMDYRQIVRKIASQVLGYRFKTEGFNSHQRDKFREWMRSHNVFINPKRSNADVKTLRKQIELASVVYDVRYVMVDHLDFVSDTSKAKETHEQIKEVVSEIHDMAMTYDVHIFLIAHMKQNAVIGGKPHMGLLKGSSSIKQYANNILMLDKKDTASAPDNRVIVIVEKNRFFGTRGEVTLRYIHKTESYIENSQCFEPQEVYEES